MKNLSLFIAILLLGSCGKKYTCSHRISYRQPAIAFVGFGREAIKTAVMTRYVVNSAYGQVISTSAVDTSGIVFSGDTAYMAITPPATYQGFFYIDKGADYKIKLGNPAIEYTLSRITSGATEELWTQQEECSPGASPSRITTFNLQLNGADYSPVVKGAKNYFIFLKQ